MAGFSKAGAAVFRILSLMNDQLDNEQRMKFALAALSTGNGAPFVGLLADDIVWNAKGSTRWSGSYRGKPSVLAVLREVSARVEGAYRMHASRVIAQGDFVVVEARGDNALQDGQRYDNEYCWVCRFEGGQLRELTEYLDTELTNRVLKRAPSPA
jgi:uncharacterized protein